jgi:serine/threonine protein kinase
MREIEQNPIQWEFDDNFSPLARDFFLKLCSYPATVRYDAQTALLHPWITRNDKDEIPPTHYEQVMNFARGTDLRKVMRLAYFTA